VKKLIVSLVLTLLAGWSSAAWTPLQTMVQVVHEHACCDEPVTSHHDASHSTQGQLHQHTCCQFVAVPQPVSRTPLLAGDFAYSEHPPTSRYTDVVHGIFKPPKSVV
jgi:hypothetical protein